MTSSPQVSKGFTLIELAIVMTIIGILAAIAIPNYTNAKERAHRASCISNQRHVAVQGTLYAADHDIQNANMNCQVLFNDGYLSEAMSECPQSGNLDHDDYDLVIQDGFVVDVDCVFRGDVHPWTP